MRELDEKYVATIDCWQGNPGAIRFHRLTPKNLALMPPVMYITGAKLQREYYYRGKSLRSLAIAHESSSSETIQRLARALSQFTNSPIIYGKSHISEFEGAMTISSTAMYEAKIAFTSPPFIKDIGPSFVIKRLKWD
jgi:rRNA maturation protein Rpf1